MQSTGHASTHAVSLVPMQGSQMIYAIDSPCGMLMPEIENKAEIIHSAQAKSTVAVPIVRSRAFPSLQRAPTYLSNPVVTDYSSMLLPSQRRGGCGINSLQLPAAEADSSRLSTLPVGVRGRSGTSSKYFGTL